MSLLTIIQAVQDITGAITGVRQAPDYPPNKVSTFPIAVCYAASGSWTENPIDCITGDHIIRLELIWARRDIERLVESALPYGDSVATALLQNRTLNNTVSYIASIDYAFGVPQAGPYAGLDVIGWSWAIHVTTDSCTGA